MYETIKFIAKGDDKNVYHGKNDGKDDFKNETREKKGNDGKDDAQDDEINGFRGMMETMHEMMPKMMENCLASMSKEEREKMLTFCHTMLREMGERFLKK